jgi:peptide/nickel transport system substrate-binding protein
MRDLPLRKMPEEVILATQRRGIRWMLFYPAGAGCWQPWVKGFTMMTNSIYNNWRMEDVWLDK